MAYPMAPRPLEVLGGEGTGAGRQLHQRLAAPLHQFAYRVQKVSPLFGVLQGRKKFGSSLHRTGQPLSLPVQQLLIAYDAVAGEHVVFRTIESIFTGIQSDHMQAGNVQQARVGFLQMA